MAGIDTTAKSYMRPYFNLDRDAQNRFFRDCTRAYERYSWVRAFLAGNEDDKGLSHLEGLVKAASDYIGSISTQMTSRSNYDPVESCVGEMVGLDKRRQQKHDALIAQLNLVNRYLFKTYKAGEEVPIGGVYSLAPETLSPPRRSIIGGWSGNLVVGIYLNSISVLMQSKPAEQQLVK